MTAFQGAILVVNMAIVVLGLAALLVVDAERADRRRHDHPDDGDRWICRRELSLAYCEALPPGPIIVRP
jgi:hypothetical protein